VRLGLKTTKHYFAWLVGTGAIFIKSISGDVTLNMYFLHPVGYAGHVVHSGASGARNIDTLFFMLVCDLYGFHKKRVGTCYAKLLFCIRWNDEDITSLDTTLLVTFNSKVK
jgi:hypothetical protein